MPTSTHFSQAHAAERQQRSLDVQGRLERDEATPKDTATCRQYIAVLKTRSDRGAVKTVLGLDDSAAAWKSGRMHSVCVVASTLSCQSLRGRVAQDTLWALSSPVNAQVGRISTPLPGTYNPKMCRHSHITAYRALTDSDHAGAGLPGDDVCIARTTAWCVGQGAARRVLGESAAHWGELAQEYVTVAVRGPGVSQSA